MIAIYTRTSAPLVKYKFNLYEANRLTASTLLYKLGPERLTRLGNSNVLRLPVNALSEIRMASDF